MECQNYVSLKGTVTSLVNQEDGRIFFCCFYFLWSPKWVPDKKLSPCGLQNRKGCRNTGII